MNDIQTQISETKKKISQAREKIHNIQKSTTPEPLKSAQMFALERDIANLEIILNRLKAQGAIG